MAACGEAATPAQRLLGLGFVETGDRSLFYKGTDAHAPLLVLVPGGGSVEGGVWSTLALARSQPEAGLLETYAVRGMSLGWSVLTVAPAEGDVVKDSQRLATALSSAALLESSPARPLLVRPLVVCAHSLGGAAAVHWLKKDWLKKAHSETAFVALLDSTHKGDSTLSTLNSLKAARGAPAPTTRCWVRSAEPLGAPAPLPWSLPGRRGARGRISAGTAEHKLVPFFAMEHVFKTAALHVFKTAAVFKPAALHLAKAAPAAAAAPHFPTRAVSAKENVAPPAPPECAAAGIAAAGCAGCEKAPPPAGTPRPNDARYQKEDAVAPAEAA